MAEGRLIPHHGEAIVLRTWPFHEADLLISFFTRDQGRVKGVARHAMKSRRRFGGALEPATHVRAHYTERPRQELVRLDNFEILWSPLTAPIDYLRTAGLQLVVEVLEEAMPELAPEDNIFRLALATLTAMEAGRVWLPVTYFCLWMNRLMGWMPELGHCTVCGLDLRGQTVWWSPAGDGVTCHDDRRAGSRELRAESVVESYRIARSSLPQLAEEAWPEGRASDLRAFAVGTLERHLERRLRSAVALS
ncbi:DNA repair protein RecO [Granulicella sp. S156]|jgi:DNA repair protein RecO (recombination protein O)|uniref:DNA repair protein RecO n=1 Tax=Granulicella sp. S156 TaxID=1747224 RepID=UPI00131BF4C6|nr:DNA repair protein RecO [Granulicella sp. S156]